MPNTVVAKTKYRAIGTPAISALTPATKIIMIPLNEIILASKAPVLGANNT